jgi:hypothetical protein
MTTQLTLLPSATSPWQLDPSTRAIGHRGLAAARAALAAAAPRTGDPFRPGHVGSVTATAEAAAPTAAAA